VWPSIDELFRDEDLTTRLADAAVQPSSLRAGFDAVIAEVLAEADLEAPATGQSRGGGRHGAHATGMGHLLAEMQVLARRHPGATW
jgi:ring-1,2-phenylacetyl-CoA epoxidase subunit PaaC